MADLALLNFIIYNFNQTLISSGLLFHCWEPPVAQIFGQWASSKGIYIQYVDIGPNKKPDFHPHLKGQYFSWERPVIGVFLDMDCKHSQFILNVSNTSKIFNERFHWILYERTTNIEPFWNFAENANLYVCSDVTYVQSKMLENGTGPTIFTLFDVYNNGQHLGGKLNITSDQQIMCNEDECHLDRYLSLLYRRTRYGNRNRQQDITVRLATVITVLPLSLSVEEKMKFLRSENNTYVDPVPRFGYRQTMILMDMLYTNHRMIFFDSWSVNSFFGGSVEFVHNGNAEITSSPYTFTTYRSRYYMAVSETAIFHSACLFRTPRYKGLSGSGQAFLEPFSPNVWIVFGIILLVTAIQLWGMFFVEYHRMRNSLDHTPSLLSSIILTLGTACVQGCYVMPGSVSGRVTYTVLALSTFLMYNYYTSIIVAILLGSPPKSDIKTLEQVADSALEIGFEPRPWIFQYTNSSQVPGVRRLVKKKIEMRKNPLDAWIEVPAAIKRLRDEIGTFGYVFEGSTGLALIEKIFKPEEICDLNEVMLRPEKALQNQLPQNSTFKELFRLRYMRILETGINRRLVKYWLRDQLNCFASNKIVAVGIEYTVPLFLLMVITFVICIFVLLLEIFHHRFGKSKLMESLFLK